LRVFCGVVGRQSDDVIFFFVGSFANFGALHRAIGVPCAGNKRFYILIAALVAKATPKAAVGREKTPQIRAARHSNDVIFFGMAHHARARPSRP
jgi:hypothetical protein